MSATSCARPRYSERGRCCSRCATGRAMHWLQRCCRRVARLAAGSASSSLPHPMPILILSRTRPSLRWERISVSHSIATAASPTAAKDGGSWTFSRRSTASAVMSDLGRTADCSCSGRAFRLMTRLRENVRARKARRIVFSIVLSRQPSPALLFFKLIEVETKFPFANSISAFSRGQDPELTSCVCADAKKPASVHLQTGSLDRTFPARDLLDHIFGKVFGPAPLRCNADYADGVKPRLDPRRVHCGMGCLVQLGHNVLRRAFRQEESRPSHDIVVRDTLLVRGRKLP